EGSHQQSCRTNQPQPPLFRKSALQVAATANDCPLCHPSHRSLVSSTWSTPSQTQGRMQTAKEIADSQRGHIYHNGSVKLSCSARSLPFSPTIAGCCWPRNERCHG